MIWAGRSPDLLEGGEGDLDRVDVGGEGLFVGVVWRRGWASIVTFDICIEGIAAEIEGRRVTEPFVLDSDPLRESEPPNSTYLRLGDIPLGSWDTSRLSTRASTAPERRGANS